MRRRGGGKAAAAAADDSAGGGGATSAAAAGDKQPAGTRRRRPRARAWTRADGGEPGKVEEEIGGRRRRRRRPTTAHLAGHRRRSAQGVPQGRPPRAGAVRGHHGQRQPDPPLRVRRRPQLLPDRRALGRRCRGSTSSSSSPTQDELVGLQYNRIADAEPLPLRRRAELRLRARLREVRLVQPVDRPLGDLGVGRRRRDVHRGHPARPGRTSSKAFKNTALTPNVGIGSRFFLTDWLTVNFALRDYIITDKFEPLAPTNGMAECDSQAACKAAADSALVRIRKYPYQRKKRRRHWRRRGYGEESKREARRV